MSRELLNQYITFPMSKDEAAAVDMLSARLCYGNRSAFMRMITRMYLEHVGALSPRAMTNGHAEQRETA